MCNSIFISHGAPACWLSPDFLINIGIPLIYYFICLFKWEAIQLFRVMYSYIPRIVNDQTAEVFKIGFTALLKELYVKPYSSYIIFAIEVTYTLFCCTSNMWPIKSKSQYPVASNRSYELTVCCLTNAV